MYTRTRRHGKWEKRRALDSLRYRSLPSFFPCRPFERSHSPPSASSPPTKALFSTSSLTHTHTSTHRLCRLPAAFRLDRKTVENYTTLEFFACDRISAHITSRYVILCEHRLSAMRCFHRLQVFITR